MKKRLRFSRRFWVTGAATWIMLAASCYLPGIRNAYWDLLAHGRTFGMISWIPLVVGVVAAVVLKGFRESITLMSVSMWVYALASVLWKGHFEWIDLLFPFIVLVQYFPGVVGLLVGWVGRHLLWEIAKMLHQEECALVADPHGETPKQ